MDGGRGRRCPLPGWGDLAAASKIPPALLARLAEPPIEATLRRRPMGAEGCRAVSGC